MKHLGTTITILACLAVMFAMGISVTAGWRYPVALILIGLSCIWLGYVLRDVSRRRPAPFTPRRQVSGRLRPPSGGIDIRA